MPFAALIDFRLTRQTLGNIDYNQLGKTLPLSLIMSHTDIREHGFLSPVGSLACVSCLKFNLHSVDSSHYFPLVSGSTTNLVFFKTQTADFFLRTRIIRMTRMSPVGSLACVSYLMFNLHSVDSSNSCSLKHKLLIFFKNTNNPNDTNEPVGSLACVSCLIFNLYSVDSSHSCSFKTRAGFFRTRIIRMTRMSPVGSLACVSCLIFNLHSVDSSHSCSFKHKLLIFF